MSRKIVSASGCNCLNSVETFGGFRTARSNRAQSISRRVPRRCRTSPVGAHHLRLASPGNVVDHGNVFLTGPENMLGTWLVATVGAAAILLVVRGLYKVVRHREGMGLGDVKLLAMIGAFLGFWPAVLSLFLGVVLALVGARFYRRSTRA